MKFLKATIALCAIYIVKAAPTSEEEDGRIIGGAELSFSRVRYQAAILSNNRIGCGGSVIGDYWILTAAHCVPGITADRIRVVVGTDNLTAVYSDMVYQAVAVNSHPRYDPRTYDYDVTVITVNRRITTGDVVPMASWEIPNGALAFVSGWGTTVVGGVMESRLRGVTLRVLTTASCRRTSNGNAITDRMFCAAESGKDSCQGDSGGPIVSGGYLIGVVSWGYGCALDGFPGAYTKLANPEIMGFIRNNMV